jgi:hypothetical protein
MRKIYFSLLSILCLLFASSALSQGIKLHGNVVDESRVGVAGASVVIKNTKTGVSCNSKGYYTITVNELPVVLVVSAVGYEKQEQKLRASDTLKLTEIVLKEDKATLEEISVVGYGSRSEAKDISYESASTSSPLSGRVAGISIRGGSSYSAKTASRVEIRSGERSKALASTVRGDSISKLKPGMLTAGELSDFKKWKLWSTYTNDEFKTWSKYWNITFKNRYCVQVLNNDYKAVVNEKVYLVNNGTKDTVWQAVTDNTGKAELWDNSDNTKVNRSEYIIYCGNQKVSNPVTFENGINKIVLKRSCNITNAVDIAFVVDATGSMGDEIRYLQEELKEVINKFTSGHKELSIRTGAVFYRDHGDEYLTRYSNLNTDLEQLTKFISKQSAGGGGDGPEAVEEAVIVALQNLQWNNEARTCILFLVLDAPPHDKEKARMQLLMKQAANKGIRIVPVVCSGADKGTEYLMRCLALATNGSYVFLTDDSGIGESHIKPTADEFKVEFLNDLMSRVMNEMTYARGCDEKTDPAVVPSIYPVLKIEIYPNPSAGRFTVNASATIKEYFITDFTGKILFRINAENKGGKIEIGLSNYPSGTYMLKFLTESKGWGSEKLILLH